MLLAVIHRCKACAKGRFDSEITLNKRVNIIKVFYFSRIFITLILLLSGGNKFPFIILEHLN